MAFPPPDSDNESSEKIVKTEPIDSHLFLNSSPQNEGKKFTTTAINVSSSDEEELEAMMPAPKAKSASANRKATTTAINVSSDEEELEAMTPTPKAKSASANRKAASTPSKTKPYVLMCSVSFLCLIFFL